MKRRGKGMLEIAEDPLISVSGSGFVTHAGARYAGNRARPFTFFLSRCSPRLLRPMLLPSLPRRAILGRALRFTRSQYGARPEPLADRFEAGLPAAPPAPRDHSSIEVSKSAAANLRPKGRAGPFPVVENDRSASVSTSRLHYVIIIALQVRASVPLCLPFVLAGCPRQNILCLSLLSVTQRRGITSSRRRDAVSVDMVTRARASPLLSASRRIAFIISISHLIRRVGATRIKYHSVDSTPFNPVALHSFIVNRGKRETRFKGRRGHFTSSTGMMGLSSLPVRFACGMDLRLMKLLRLGGRERSASVERQIGGREEGRDKKINLALQWSGGIQTKPSRFPKGTDKYSV